MLLSAAVVLVYTFLGGLTSAIYNEVLQFFLIVIGFSPLAAMAVNRAGGWAGMSARLPPVMTHAWKFTGSSAANPMGVEVFGLVAGLGFVLSFGYWCTDFLVVQRAMAANSMSAARRTPLIAAFPKMVMPFIVILPGIAAIALTQMNVGYSLPVKGSAYDYDQALTTLMIHFYPSGLMGLGLTALMASFMSGMAGNVTAFNTVFTYDLYQSYVRRNAPDDHYLRVARWTTLGGVALSIAAAYLAQRYNNIMDVLQLVFSFVNAPLFATFLLGMFWKRTTGHGAFAGLLSGTGAAALVHGLTVAEGKGGWIARRASVPIHDGAEFVDGDLRVVHVLPRHAAGEFGDAAAPRRRTARIGLQPDAASDRFPRALVPPSRAVLALIVGTLRGRPESDLLVDDPVNIGITCYPTYGGSGIVATELGLELANRGHEVHFITYSNPIRLDPGIPRIHYHEVEVSNYPLFQYPPYCLALASRMVDVADAYDLDLLHVHYAIPHSIAAMLAQQMLAPEAPPAVHHHAARHRHHAGGRRPVLLSHHQIFDREIRRRDLHQRRLAPPYRGSVRRLQ